MSDGTVVDAYGKKSGSSWVYKEGFAYRVDKSLPSPTYDEDEWVRRPEMWDGLQSNPASGTAHFPLSTFTGVQCGVLLPLSCHHPFLLGANHSG